jgi:hypothetical protein
MNGMKSIYKGQRFFLKSLAMPFFESGCAISKQFTIVFRRRAFSAWQEATCKQ